MKTEQLNELLLQSLEHERGGEKLYEAAVAAVKNEDLKKEFEKYLQETRHHAEVMESLCREFGLDLEQQTPGRQIVAALGDSLVNAMQTAAQKSPEAAELVACECITLAETKDHLNWELLAQCAKSLKGEQARKLKEAVDEIEEQEDEHLYHSKGWCRELWLDSLGLKAVLPPPEERKHVKSAIGAARAEQARDTMKPRAH